VPSLPTRLTKAYQGNPGLESIMNNPILSCRYPSFAAIKFLHSWSTVTSEDKKPRSHVKLVCMQAGTVHSRRSFDCLTSHAQALYKSGLRLLVMGNAMRVRFLLWPSRRRRLVLWRLLMMMRVDYRASTYNANNFIKASSTAGSGTDGGSKSMLPSSLDVLPVHHLDHHPDELPSIASLAAHGSTLQDCE